MSAIYPTILTDNMAEAQQQLDAVAGKVRTVQIDIIDGQFADNLTLEPLDFLTLNFHDLKADAHLMTVDPIQDVIELAQLPNLRHIVGQIERMPSQEAFAEHVWSYKKGAGLSLDLYTPLEEIDETLLDKLEVVQIMTVQAGAQGRPFAEQALEKVKTLAQWKKERRYTYEIMVDGGISEKTLPLCKQAGAEGFGVGHALWDKLMLD